MENSCEIKVGRLMEIDVAAGYKTVDDVLAMMGMIRSVLGTVPTDTRVIIAADWRPCSVFSPEVADKCIAMLTAVNDRIERSAILHRPDSAISVLQVFRLVRDSHWGHRRVFTEPAEVETWLAEILDPRELKRLTTFLAQR